uniref:NADH-ubiquinone oxidoreductase chain 1 n=1 Tax=Elaeophora elaphi TaxID=1147741 RepID=A0A0R3S3A9_9BILA
MSEVVQTIRQWPKGGFDFVYFLLCWVFFYNYFYFASCRFFYFIGASFFKELSMSIWFNKVGYCGLLQTFFDGFKLLKKEQLFLYFSSWFSFLLVPIFSFSLMEFLFILLCCLAFLEVVGIFLMGGYLLVLEVILMRLFFYLFNVLVDFHRAPFDLFECEGELVRGFNVEYSRVGFASLFLSEYGNLLYFSCLTSSVFSHRTYPRLRFDFLMSTCWFFLPIGFYLFGFSFAVFMLCLFSLIF